VCLDKRLKNNLIESGRENVAAQTFSIISALVESRFSQGALCQLGTATLISFSTLIFMGYLDFITLSAENPALHK
jgi:hypothetical protein